MQHSNKILIRVIIKIETEKNSMEKKSNPAGKGTQGIRVKGRFVEEEKQAVYKKSIYKKLIKKNSISPFPKSKLRQHCCLQYITRFADLSMCIYIIWRRKYTLLKLF